jgi:hypothetical protein
MTSKPFQEVLNITDKMKTNKAQGMQFAWIFALIIGAAILFLAVFFSGKLLQTGTYQTEAELSKSLDVLLNPFASVSQAEVTLSKPVSLPEVTQVNFSCSSSQDSETMSILLKKGETPFQNVIKNKYIFSEDFNTKDLWIFGKPFNAAWKVDDLIFVVSRNYCFIIINPDDKIGKELRELNASLIQVVSDAGNCKAGSISVCFSGICDIYVNSELNYVRTKSGNVSNFIDDATMYAAIFGPRMYDCNIGRLMKRLSSQADIFIAKADLLAGRGCYEINAVKPELEGLKAAAESTKPIAIKLATIKYYASRIESENPISCPLY